MSRGSLALVICPKLEEELNILPAPTGALKLG